jgi:NAD(P)-dependent dehydrogenase (short-subunit alcohol dehydrogenase family)/acyl-coenzyme A synthetase/AMP-(fatty) acid ligase
MISSKATSSQVATMLQDSAVKLVFTDLQIDTNLVVYDLTQVLEKFAISVPFESYRPNDDDPAIILHTSGSTGNPRRVKHTHRARLNILATTGYSTYKIKTLLGNPFYHAMGIHSLDSRLYTKDDIVFLRKFEPVAYLKVVDSLCPTNLIGVPSMFAMLMLQQELVQTLNLSSVKHITLSGGATTPCLNNQLTQAFKKTSIQVGYGSTELGSKIFGNHATLPRPPMSVGCEREGILYRLVDTVLQVRSPYMMNGYDDDNSSFTHDGYYITNDQFRIDQDGFYYFIGRSDDMFKSGGNKIFPSEIERVIEQYPGVDKCVALPIKDSIKEFKPCAFVTLVPGSATTSQDLSNFLIDKLARYQIPRQIWILNSMPLTASNKIDKQQLTVLAEQNLNTQTHLTEPIMNLINKVAVITGGAGHIGQATAHRLASHGARIFSLVRRNIDEAQDLLDELPNKHLDHRALLVDVKDSTQIKQAAEIISKLAGRCDILVNSAAIALHPAKILDFPDDQFDEIVAVNLKGPWLMIKEFYPLLKHTGDGLVINISSVASVKTRPTSVFYSATKAGLNAMSESLAKALGPEVRVVALAPSMLPTPVSGYPFVLDKKFGELQINTLVNDNPVKRLCTAEDVAGVIENLAINMKFYNGHLIILDGGLTL